MTSLRKLLAFNIKENRRELGLTQEKLAEKTDLSTQYIAMIELSRKFPSPEVLERLAFALEVDTPELFSISPSLDVAAQKLRRAILADLEQTVGDTVNTAVRTAVSSLVDAQLDLMKGREKSIPKKAAPLRSKGRK